MRPREEIIGGQEVNRGPRGLQWSIGNILWRSSGRLNVDLKNITEVDVTGPKKTTIRCFCTADVSAQLMFLHS